jgi:hypothetical protein
MEYLSSAINKTFQIRPCAVDVIYCICFIFVFVPFLANVEALLPYVLCNTKHLLLSSIITSKRSRASNHWCELKSMILGM